jgi:hypothetical protein
MAVRGLLYLKRIRAECVVVDPGQTLQSLDVFCRVLARTARHKSRDICRPHDDDNDEWHSITNPRPSASPTACKSLNLQRSSPHLNAHRECRDSV